MRIDHTGRITDDFFVLGHPAQPLYLLDGDAPALFDSGYTAMALVFEAELEHALAGRDPAYLFLTHSHFDHIGSAAHLKSVWPALRVVASAGVARVLERPGAVRVIRELNETATDRVREMLPSGSRVHERPFEPFGVDVVVEDGQRLRLDDERSVVALASPGHTRDMMSYYVPEKRILVATEAIGIEDAEGYITSDFLVGYDLYRESLDRLGLLSVDVLCQGHGMVFTGADAPRRLARARESAVRFAERLERLLREERGDVDRVAALVKAEEYDRKSGVVKLPEPAYLLNLYAKVRTVWERMQPPR